MIEAQARYKVRQAMMTRCNVLIVDQNQLFREGLKHLLPKARFTVNGGGNDLAEVTKQAAHGTPTDLIILTLEAGSSLEAVLAQVALSRRNLPLVKFVILAASLSAAEFLQTMQSGVSAVLTTNISSDVLRMSLELILQQQQVLLVPTDHLLTGAGLGLNAEPAVVEARSGKRNESWDADGASNLVPFAPLRSVSGDGAAYPAARPVPVPAAPAEPSNASSLSERENQILRCLVKGFSNKAIARELNLADTTVKVHVKGLMRKVGAANRTQVAIWAMNHHPTAGEPAAEAVSSGHRKGSKPSLVVRSSDHSCPVKNIRSNLTDH